MKAKQETMTEPRGMRVRLYPTKAQEALFARAFQERNWWYNIHLNWYLGQYKPVSEIYRNWRKENPNRTDAEDKAFRDSLPWPSTNKMGWPKSRTGVDTRFRERYGEPRFIAYNAMNEACEDDLGRAIAMTPNRWKLCFASIRKTKTFCVPIPQDRSTGLRNIGVHGNLRKIRIPFLNKNDRKKNPELEWVKCAMSKSAFMQSVEQKAVTVSQDATGAYWAAIRITVPKREHKETGMECGIDVGCRTLATFAIAETGSDTAEGDVFREYKPNKERDSLIDSEIRNLNRQKSRIIRTWARLRASDKTMHGKGNANASRVYTRGHKSKRYRAIEHRIALLNAKRKRCINDTVEKISHDASMFDRVGVESLNVTGMLKNHRLARTIAGASMGRLLERIKHKCREVVPAGKFYASSKTCAFCGGHYAELGSKEVWTCPHCGRVCPRDRNAASNLRPSVQAGKPVGQSTEGQRKQPNADSRRNGKLRKTVKRKEVQTQGQYDKSAGAASASAGLSSVGMTMAGVQLPLF